MVKSERVDDVQVRLRPRLRRCLLLPQEEDDDVHEAALRLQPGLRAPAVRGALHPAGGGKRGRLLVVVPTGLLNLRALQIYGNQNRDIFVVLLYSNDMFRYMFKAEFVTLVSLKVPSGCCILFFFRGGGKLIA